MAVAAALASLVLLTTVHCWINEYDQPVHYQCPTGQFLSHVNSQHDNRYEDRVWDFECRGLPVAEVEIVGCHWTSRPTYRLLILRVLRLYYINEFDQPVTYQCPGEGFITGIESVHDNGHEDRRFKYQCCEAQGAITHGCFFTDWENDLDGILDYIVPIGKVMRGMDSYHDNGKEDRRFKFEICDIEVRPTIG